MNISDIKKEVTTSNWQPEFSWVSDIDVLADMINRPHEDYPLNVEKTKELIIQCLDYRMDSFTFSEACYIQKELYENKMRQVEEMKLTLPNCYIKLGIRNLRVKVGDWVPPHTMFLDQLIKEIFPVSQNWGDLKEWYKTFQTIHPFNDLNGRVGGIILAVLSKNNNHFLTLKR